MQMIFQYRELESANTDALRRFQLWIVKLGTKVAFWTLNHVLAPPLSAGRSNALATCHGPGRGV